uniref:Dymeclin n=2 Tax=Hemiselmis andersenii TaxID=464988 RepID=A0A6T8IN87_HEMAN
MGDTGGVSEKARVYGELLKTCLEVINSILTYALPRNLNLIYALVHRKDAFVRGGACHPPLSGLMENVSTVIHFFSKRVDKGLNPNDPASPESVMQQIKDASLSWGAHLRMFPELRFSYQQDDRPEDFFVPYVWGIVLSHSGLAWNPQKSTLFAPR